MPTVGVVVFSLPGMKSLDRCLKSVEWADSVTVHEPGAPLPENATDWVCSLWGEECVEPVLREELLALRGRDLKSAAASYRVPVRSRVLGKWLKGSLWGPSPALRVRRQGPALPYEWLGLLDHESRGAKALSGWLSDYSPADLSAAFSRLNMVCEASAVSRSAGGQTVQGARAVLASFTMFFRIVRANGVTSGGIASLTLAMLAAYGRILSAAKAREKSGAG